MQQLNLPAFNYKLKNKEGKVLIFDIIRRKDVTCTPEEWVRQHFLHYMINELKYPKTLIKIEGGLNFNTLKKRSDIVVHNRQGIPWLIVECKSPDQKIDNTTLQQAAVYNATIKASFIALTNGMTHVCCCVEKVDNKLSVLKEFPSFD